MPCCNKVAQQLDFSLFFFHFRDTGVKVKCLVAINKEPTICEAKFNLPTSYFLLIGMSFGSQILILYTVGLQIRQNNSFVVLLSL